MDQDLKLSNKTQLVFIVSMHEITQLFNHILINNSLIPDQAKYNRIIVKCMMTSGHLPIAGLC